MFVLPQLIFLLKVSSPPLPLPVSLLLTFYLGAVNVEFEVGGTTITGEPYILTWNFTDPLYATYIDIFCTNI
jgi:hypothetical protein